MRYHRSLTPIAAALAAIAACWAPVVQAEPVSAAGKGIAGGALLGGEAALMTQSALGVRPAWAYWLGGSLGAVGGGVGGYLVEQGGDARLSMLMLTAGTALLIPAAIMTVDARSYEPDPAPSEDTSPRARLDLPERDLPAFGLPSVAIAQVYSSDELAMSKVGHFKLDQQASLRVSLVNMVF